MIPVLGAALLTLAAIYGASRVIGTERPLRWYGSPGLAHGPWPGWPL